MSEIAVPAGSGWTEADLTISDETAARLEAAQSANTQEAYARNWSRFTAWCGEQGRSSLPATPHTLLEYVHDLTSRTPPPAPATVYQIIATIKTAHRDAGYPGQPEARASLQLMRGYRRERADAGFRVRKAAPLSPDDIRAMAATCNRQTMAGLRDRALILLGYSLAGRASELTGLNLADIRSAGEHGLLIYIRKSKTDQEARGVEMNVPYGRYEETCTVRAVRAWMTALAEHGISGGPLFRRIDGHGLVVGADTLAPRFYPEEPRPGQCAAGDCYRPAKGGIVIVAGATPGTGVRVSAAGLDIMEAVGDAPADDPVWGRRLCRQTGYSTGTVVGVLDKLLKAGWVADRWEEPQAAGRPQVRFYALTEDGRAAYREALAERDSLAYCKKHYRRMIEHGSTADLGASGDGVLERGAVTYIVRWHAQVAGIPEPESISGHSLRSGMATELYARRVPDSAIAEIGRWAQGSQARRAYERVANMTENNPLRNVDL